MKKLVAILFIFGILLLIVGSVLAFPPKSDESDSLIKSTVIKSSGKIGYEKSQSTQIGYATIFVGIGLLAAIGFIYVVRPRLRI